MAIINTGAIERNITGVNESETFTQDSRTNLLPYSEHFNFWTSNEVTTQRGFLAPDGSNNATKVVSNGSNSYIAKSSVASGNYARTIYAKTVSGSGTLQLLSHNANTNNIFTITENWQRFELNSTTQIPLNFYAVDFRGSSTLSEVIIWGAQLEEVSEATEYIPTSGSPVTIDNNSTSTVTNTGAVERGIEASHDANFVHPIGDEELVSDIDTDLSNSPAFAFAISQELGLSVGETYIVNYEIYNHTQGEIIARLGSSLGIQRGSNGVYSEELTAQSTSLIFQPRFNGFSGAIRNVSVKEVLVNRESTVTNTGAVEREIEASHDANFVHPLGDELITNGGFDSDSDWSKFGSWAISEGVASFDSSLSGAANIIQDIDSLESGKSYRLNFDVLESNGLNILYRLGVGTPFITLAQVQSNTSYSLNVPFSSTTKKLFLRGSSSFTGSIDNVSLKELLVNRESTVTNTGAVERNVSGINESNTF